jgi:hypothetical protein
LIAPIYLEESEETGWRVKEICRPVQEGQKEHFEWSKRPLILTGTKGSEAPVNEGFLCQVLQGNKALMAKVTVMEAHWCLARLAKNGRS